MAEIFGGEDAQKSIEKLCERRVGGGRLGKVTNADFALARGQRVGADRAERDGVDGVDAHGAGDTLTRAERNTKPRRDTLPRAAKSRPRMGRAGTPFDLSLELHAMVFTERLAMQDGTFYLVRPHSRVSSTDLWDR